jgi:hypothetical protein
MTVSPHGDLNPGPSEYKSPKPVNSDVRCGVIERERERKLRGVVRDTTVLEGGVIET